MNLLYIIGNGFDINLGLETGYQEFYNHYKDVQNDDPDIIAMKESIENGRYSTWSDLEEGLGKYTKMIQDPGIFTKCLNDIKECLSEYVNSQYETRRYDKNLSKIVGDFSHPEHYFDEQVANAFKTFCRIHHPAINLAFDFSIVTLNYTNTIEDLLSNSRGIDYPILHIHGQLDDGIVMGVSDLEQVSNVAFRGNRDIREEFVKPDYNDACLNARNSSFEDLLNSADVIALFGTSLGPTDRKWWRLIGKRLLDKSYEIAVLYFPYDQKKDTRRHPNYRLRWTEEYQKVLLKAFEIPEAQFEDVLARLFIGINTSIFKLPMKEQTIIVGSGKKTRA